MARAIEKGATYLDKLCHKLYSVQRKIQTYWRDGVSICLIIEH